MREVQQAQKLQREINQIDERITTLATRGSAARFLIGDGRDELKELRERRRELEHALTRISRKLGGSW